MAKKPLSSTPKRMSNRTHHHVFALNDDENKALCRYLKKYKITNKAKFIRETLMIAIIRKMEEDHPRLFD
jgi:folate-binding Fe-S cluster repair protein YgfZ